MNTIIKELTLIRDTVELTMKNIESGKDINSAIRTLNISLDKQMARIAKARGGQTFFYKKNNETAWDLSMGDVV